MSKGLGLCVGLNSVDPKHYQGWDGRLTACEFDALSMASLLTAQGFETSTLLTKQATREHVLTHISEAAALLVAGDMFVFTNSSHGGQLPDLNGDESDGADETIAMFDGEITDDELYGQWAKFAPGVRVLVLSDSCHSGTITRAKLRPPSLLGASKAIPPAVNRATYYANREMYDPILSSRLLAEARQKVRASVQLISGCADNQESYDGAFNGLFTGTLLKTWNAGKFSGNYTAFRKRITASMPPEQTPNLYRVGGADSVFWAQKPFTL